jgi:erythromycin esterase-like protein
VTAASNWDEPAQRMRVRPALSGSIESLCHRTGLGNFMLDLAPTGAASVLLQPAHLERAIGVIYRPDTERQSHYFHASVARQFDALLHYDTTRAVEPLERTAVWEHDEAPETYPTAL